MRKTRVTQISIYLIVLFKLFDTDDDGSIGEDDLTSILCLMGGDN
jgi:Ca2+-binding EF-hand superfamily protein